MSAHLSPQPKVFPLAELMRRKRSLEHELREVELEITAFIGAAMIKAHEAHEAGAGFDVPARPHNLPERIQKHLDE